MILRNKHYVVTCYNSISLLKIFISARQFTIPTVISGSIKSIARV